MKKIIKVNEKRNLTESYFINEIFNKYHGVYKVYNNINNFMYFEKINYNGKRHGIQQRYDEINKKRRYIQTNINNLLSGIYINFNY